MDLSISNENIYIIKKLKKMKKNSIVSIYGWIDFDDANNFLLSDYSGSVAIKGETSNLNYRDLVAIVGVYDVLRDEIKVEHLTIVNKNTVIDKKELNNELDNFLKYSYLYNLKQERIDLLKKINILEEATRKFFIKEYDFIELQSPIFWTKVQEYGEKEWISNYAGDSSECYVLPQSPEVISFLNAIGGVQRNIIFGKCFRKEEHEVNSNVNNDRLIEFTQLIITASFFDLKHGKEMINRYLSNIMHILKLEDDYEINSITYSNSMHFYNTDKPDLRYREIYSPIICDELMGKEYQSIIIPDCLNQKVILSLSKLIEKYIEKYDYIIQTVDRNQNKAIYNGINSTDIKNKYMVESFTIILFINHNNAINKIINGVSSRIHPYLKNVNRNFKKYSFTWITDITFDLNDKKIAHNIFSNIDIEDILLKKPQDRISKNIDLVLNGVEIASAGIEEHRSDRFIKLLEFYEIKDIEKKYGYFINALKSGAPPIFLIAFGWERFLWLLLNTRYIQEVVNFPKDEYGKCHITNTPQRYLDD